MGGCFDVETHKVDGVDAEETTYFVLFQVCGAATLMCAVGGKMHSAFGRDQVSYKYAVTMFRRIKAEVLEGTGDPDSEWTGALRHARTKDLQ